MIVGSPRYEQHLKSLGFDIFDDIIDKSYDVSYSYTRVDKIFVELDKFLKKDIDLRSIKDRLLANQQRVNQYILEQQKLS